MLGTLEWMLNVGGGSTYWFERQPVTHLGYFRTQVVNKRWWLVDPDGKPWLSLGVSVIRNRPTPGYPRAAEQGYFKAANQRYAEHAAWAKAQANRLRRWGFNTIGSWSSPEMLTQGVPYTILLEVSQYCGVTPVDRHHGEFPDVFDPAFKLAAEKAAADWCEPHQEDALLVGYFTDNELDWEQHFRGSSMFDYFFGKEAAAPGKTALVRQLEERYQGSSAAFNRAWDAGLADFKDLLTRSNLIPGPAADLERVAADKDAFLRRVAEGYFSICENAIRAVDENHMILGCRFGGRAAPAVFEVCGKHVDVISFNNYGYDVPLDQLRPIFDATLRPIMITEFSFKAMDSGLPNSKGAGIPVMTQEDRAEGYERYVTQALRLPYVVGLHWFMHHDQSASGSDDRGENSNYGLVDSEDEPYFTLVEHMRRVNQRAVEIAKSAPILPGPSAGAG